jgi:hypothetical protein
MRATATITLIAAALVGVTGCGQLPIAYGEGNSIIAAMDTTVWNQVGDSVQVALEPTILTTRQERAFDVTYQDPNAGATWGNLRRFRHLLLAGTRNDPWMKEPLEQVGDSAKAPGLYTAHDVWATGQTIDLILLTKADAGSEILPYLSKVEQSVDQDYRAWAKARMYTSGVNSALADTLETEGRFSLLLPKVYRWTRPADSVYIFRNDNPDPSQLIRQVMVTWQSPIPPHLQAKDLLDWRQRVVSKYYSEPQDLDLSQQQGGPFRYEGLQAYEIQALWKNPPSLNWPAAGPFILRAIVCPQQNRMYLLDSWLYAPNKDKYQYMIQLRTILDTFKCSAP